MTHKQAQEICQFNEVPLGSPFFLGCECHNMRRHIISMISIIIATFNAEAVLQGAIDSVSAQVSQGKELLVVDGGSTDSTDSIIVRNSASIAWSVSEPDSGIFDAWNKGIANAKGEWLYFMGADDRFADARVLAEIAPLLDRVPPNSLIAYANVELVDAKGSAITSIGAPWNADRFRHTCMSIPHQATFHRRELFSRFGLFDTSKRYTSTYEMLLRYLKNNDAIYLGAIPVSKMGVGGVSTSAANQSKFYWAYIEAQKTHGTFKPNLELLSKLIFSYIHPILSAMLSPSKVNMLLQRLRALASLWRRVGARFWRKS